MPQDKIIVGSDIAHYLRAERNFLRPNLGKYVTAGPQTVLTGTLFSAIHRLENILTPFIAAAIVLTYATVGFVWLKRGWYREKQEVSTMDGWSSMTNLQWRLLVALAQDRGISIKDQNVHTSPQEVRDVCLSVKRRRAAEYEP